MPNSLGTIIYIGGMELPDGNAAAHRVINNAKAFSDLGYKVVFCGMDRSIENDAYEPVVVNGFESYPSKYPNGVREWVKNLFSFNHTKYVLDRYNDVKFIIAYNMHANPLSNVIKYAKEKNIKVIADITEWYENRFSINPVRFMKWYDTNKVMRFLHKRVDGIISISSYLTEYYKDSVKNIIQLPPLIDISDAVWYQDSPDDKTVKFVYAGNSGKDKDKLNIIISAFAELQDKNDYSFMILGLTQEQFLKDYPELAPTVRSLSNKVFFKGRVNHSESVRALSSCDYCIFIRNATRKNMAGFPTKFVECVTSGIGVITNRVSDIGDYFPLDNSQLLEVADVLSIKVCLEKAIDGGKILHRRSDVFDYRKYIDDINVFFRKLNDENAVKL